MRINHAYRNFNVCLYTSEIRRGDFIILNTKWTMNFAVYCQLQKKKGMERDAFVKTSSISIKEALPPPSLSIEM